MPPQWPLGEYMYIPTLFICTLYVTQVTTECPHVYSNTLHTRALCHPIDHWVSICIFWRPLYARSMSLQWLLSAHTHILTPYIRALCVTPVTIGWVYVYSDILYTRPLSYSNDYWVSICIFSHPIYARSMSPQWPLGANMYIPTSLYASSLWLEWLLSEHMYILAPCIRALYVTPVTKPWCLSHTCIHTLCSPRVCLVKVSANRGCVNARSMSPQWLKSDPCHVHLYLHETQVTHCNTLQHTATHCNILQHTATHCNTLQHTATHCNTL